MAQIAMIEDTTERPAPATTNGGDGGCQTVRLRTRRGLLRAFDHRSLEI